MSTSTPGQSTGSQAVLSPLFPDAASGLSLRYGLARTAGSFEHPILACIMIIAVCRLQLRRRLVA